MSDPKLEEVFKISGVPTHTFVQPSEFNKLLVSLRTPGRGVVVEGPSGIGKTSAVETALRELGMGGATKLSARKKADVEYIELLPSLGVKGPDAAGRVGLVIVDDFHRLPDTTKHTLADFLKTLADEERTDIKIVVVGINRAGERLVGLAADLVNRIDVIRFENNPEHKVLELLEKGQSVLNIDINVIDEIVDTAQGSFYVAQLLAHEVCLKSDVMERAEARVNTAVSFEGVRATVWDRLSMTFYEPCRRSCQGSKMRSAGRAPYLHILHALAAGEDWSLDLRDLRKFGALRASVGQVVEKGFLRDLIKNDPDIPRLLHFDEKILTVEDPQFVFFIKHIPWAHFTRAIGFVEVPFEKRYDFALSFAGADRDLAEALFTALDDEEVAVFYDKNEQHRILAENVEEYLRPIYQSEASFVVCLLGPEYPKRIWTKIESDSFRDRLDDGAVIPIWFASAPPGMFDETRAVGGLDFDRAMPLDAQAKSFAEALVRKLTDARSSEKPAAV